MKLFRGAWRNVESIRHLSIEHTVVDRAAPLSSFLQVDKDDNTPGDLISLGAVYWRPRESGDSARAKRVTSDFMLDKGDYIRVHYEPRRFDLSGIDWKSRVVRDFPDFLVVNKPAGLPSNPNPDNLHENVVSCLKNEIGLDAAFLVHRLDVDTSGLLIVAKTSIAAARLGDIFRFRAISKRYRLVVASECLDSLESLRAVAQVEGGGLLTSLTYPGDTSAKVFTAVPSESTLDPTLLSNGTEKVQVCTSLIHRASPAVSLTRRQWLDWVEAAAVRQPGILPMKEWMNSGEGPHDQRKVSLCELEIELITGRTHQCRGQVSCVGPTIHVAGDNVYKGCTTTLTPNKFSSSPAMALQACALYVGPSSELPSLWKKRRWAKAISTEVMWKRGEIVRGRDSVERAGIDFNEMFAAHQGELARLENAWWDPLANYLRNEGK